MTHRNRFNLLIACLLILFTITPMLSPIQAQEPKPQDNAGLRGSPLDSAFTYQGRLVDNSTGTPTAGPCDFQFSLWDTAGGGTQIGSTQIKTNVTLSNGYFSSALDFGVTAFQGEARYLQIGVRCPAGSGGYTTLTGRIALTGTPYAHSLRPGAVISGASTGTILSAQNTNTFGGAVAGSVGAASGLTPITGAGVWGDSSSVPGVAGTSKSAVGVFGWSSNNHGVVGLSTSGEHSGVNGSSPYIGVFGEATAASGNNFGVYGKSTSGYGVYSEGDAHVEGSLTWRAKTSYISIPAAAFHPAQEGYEFNNDGKVIWNLDGDSVYYLAQLQLPHEAIITKLTFYWWDGSQLDGRCELYRIDLMGGENQMAVAYTHGSTASPNGSVDANIDFATVDNSSYAYYLWLYLPDNLIAAYGVVIEYTFTGPY